jgi:PAS domain S-box-containing protein
MASMVRERSLSLYLAAFAAALTIPLLIVAGMVIWRYASAESRGLEATAAHRSDDIAADIDRVLAARFAILQALATSPSLDSGDIEGFDAQAREFSGVGVDIRLRRVNGLMLVDTGLPKGAVLHSWPIIPPIQRVIDTKSPYFTNLYVSRDRGQHEVAIFLPVIRGGEARYLLSSVFNPDFFAQMLRARGMGPPYFASLADRSGVIIARSDRHAETIGRPLPGFAETPGTSGAWRGVNPQGVAVSAFYRRSDISGWLVTTGVDERILRAPLVKSLLWLLAAAAVLFGVSVLTAGAIMHRLAAASTTMTNAAAAVARGQLTVVPKTGIREVNQVGDAFAQASIKLHVQATALARANRDLEERVEQRSEELKASEERYRLLAENASDLIVLRNIPGRVFYASPSSTKLLGFTPEEMLEVTPVDLVHPDDWERVNAINRAIGEGLAEGFSIHRLRHKDGHWVWIQAAYSRLSDVGPDQPNIMAVVRDDTERQLHETKLRQSNEALKQFSAIVSHDLQAPLRHINMFADMLRAKVGDADEEATGYAVRIMASVERMQRLIRSLIGYTQVAYARVKIEEVPLARTVADAVALLEADIREAKAEVRVFNLPMVKGDADLLVRLFQNLIANAIKYRNAEPPVVKIRARPAGRNWEISVEDNGIGIDPQYRERIFEIFKRLHRDESRYPGMGVGLALCRRIVESHDGEIWLDTEHSQGARFRFTLPRKRDQVGLPAGGDDGHREAAHADR